MTKKEFRNEFEKIIDEFEPVFLNRPWDRPEMYAGWLSQTYHFVKHSTRLLSIAAGRARLDQENFHKRFIAHVAEETNHEKLAENDLKNMGFSVGVESNEARRFHRFQFDILDVHGPAVFMGWILFLEGLACKHGPTLLHKVKHYGEKSTTFLKLHSEEDQEHIESALELVDSISESELELVLENLVTARDNYQDILEYAEKACRAATLAA